MRQIKCYYTRPSDFFCNFKFNICNCQRSSKNPLEVSYRVVYETLPYSDTIETIRASCTCCNKYIEKDVSSMNIDCNYLR